MYVPNVSAVFARHSKYLTTIELNENLSGYLIENGTEATDSIHTHTRTHTQYMHTRTRTHKPKPIQQTYTDE